jgi:hypothetical protein
MRVLIFVFSQCFIRGLPLFWYFIQNFIHIWTEDGPDVEIMSLGLLTAKYDEEQLWRCCDKTNQYQFKITFGVTPRTIFRIYKDLQTSTAEDKSTNPPRSMRLKGSITNLKWFLRTVYYLRKYPTEDDIDRILKIYKGWARTVEILTSTRPAHQYWRTKTRY